MVRLSKSCSDYNYLELLNLTAKGLLTYKAIRNFFSQCRRIFRNQDKSEPVPKFWNHFQIPGILYLAAGYFGAIRIYSAHGGRIFRNHRHSCVMRCMISHFTIKINRQMNKIKYLYWKLSNPQSLHSCEAT